MEPELSAPTTLRSLCGRACLYASKSARSALEVAAVAALSAALDHCTRPLERSALAALHALCPAPLRNQPAPFRTLALDHAARAVDLLSGANLTLGLGDGYCAVTLLLEYALALCGVPFDGERSAAVDELVLLSLNEQDFAGSHDLVSGLTGLGVYGRARSALPSGKAIVSRTLDLLESAAERDGDGLRLRTPDWHLSPVQRPHYREGRWDVGLTHGAAGLVTFLSALVRGRLETARATRLLQGTVKWLSTTRRPEGAGSRYPSWLAPDGERPTARLGWCYGDATVGLALLTAARALGDAGLEREARVTLGHAARTPASDAGLSPGFEGDALCHGAAGIGRLLWLAGRATDDAALRTVATRWLARAERGLAARLESAPAGGEGAHPLLDGEPGVAFALLGAAHPALRGWDQWLFAPDGAGDEGR